MKKARDFRDMSAEEFSATVEDLQKELFVLKNEKKASKKTEKPHLIVHKKKELARALTVKREKQLSA